MLLGCLFLVAPVQASGWAAFQVHEPASRWDLMSPPLVPAPLETSIKPLQLDNETPAWSYPTEVSFVSYPVTPVHNLWVAIALERYQIRLFSPLDYPYLAFAKAPLSLH